MTSLRVVHSSPGRLRLRLPPGADPTALGAAIAAGAGVTSWTWSPRTRGLLILYEPGVDDAPARIVDLAARHTGRDVIDGRPPSVALDGRGPALANGVRSAFGEADRTIQRATRGLVGLAGLVPLLLTAWALREVVRGRAAPLTWSAALWYAHGLFRDYQMPSSSD